MARCAGGLRGSGTRGRRAHGPAPALARSPRTPRARSAAAARDPAAIFPASRPARPRRTPARPRPAPVMGGARSCRLPLGQSARARFPGGGNPTGPAPPGADSDGSSRGSAAGAAGIRAGLELRAPTRRWRRAGPRSCERRGSRRGQFGGRQKGPACPRISQAQGTVRARGGPLRSGQPGDCGGGLSPRPWGSRPEEGSGPTWKPHPGGVSFEEVRCPSRCEDPRRSRPVRCLGGGRTPPTPRARAGRGLPAVRRGGRGGRGVSGRACWERSWRCGAGGTGLALWCLGRRNPGRQPPPPSTCRSPLPAPRQEPAGEGVRRSEELPLLPCLGQGPCHASASVGYWVLGPQAEKPSLWPQVA